MSRVHHSVQLGIYKLPHALDDLPAYETAGSAGMDLRAAIESPLVLHPSQRYLVPTGLIFHIPEGYEVQLRARSGLSIKHGVTLINGIGTIDSDYRNEIMVALVNLGQTPYTIEPGERICQMVIAPITQLPIEVLSETSKVATRQGGFGSTGRL